MKHSDLKGLTSKFALKIYIRTWDTVRLEEHDILYGNHIKQTQLNRK